MGGPVITSRGARERGSRPLLRTMIGERLRRTRRDQGRTLSDVSRAARVSVPYLSEVERGRKEASSEVLAAICDALRIDLSDLLAGVAHDLAAGACPPRRGRPAGLGGWRRRGPAPSRGARATPGACWRRGDAASCPRWPAAPASARPVAARPPKPPGPPRGW